MRLVIRDDYDEVTSYVGKYKCIYYTKIEKKNSKLLGQFKPTMSKSV